MHRIVKLQSQMFRQALPKEKIKLRKKGRIVKVMHRKLVGFESVRF